MNEIKQLLQELVQNTEKIYIEKNNCSDLHVRKADIVETTEKRLRRVITMDILKRFKNHYWDSLEKDKTLIRIHLTMVIEQWENENKR